MELLNNLKKFNQQNYSFLFPKAKESVLKFTEDGFVFEVLYENKELRIDVYKNKDLIAYCWVYVGKDSLESGYVDVSEDYQRQGLATLMYEVLEQIADSSIENTENQRTKAGLAFKNSLK